MTSYSRTSSTTRMKTMIFLIYDLASKNWWIAPLRPSKPKKEKKLLNQTHHSLRNHLIKRLNLRNKPSTSISQGRKWKSKSMARKNRNISMPKQERKMRLLDSVLTTRPYWTKYSKNGRRKIDIHWKNNNTLKNSKTRQRIYRRSRPFSIVRNSSAIRNKSGRKRERSRKGRKFVSEIWQKAHQSQRFWTAGRWVFKANSWDWNI